MKKSMAEADLPFYKRRHILTQYNNTIYARVDYILNNINRPKPLLVKFRTKIDALARQLWGE